jgi:hypothetical protein
MWTLRKRTGIRRLVVVIAVLAASGAASCMWSAEQARRREAGYQAQLAGFAQTFKPGMSRKELEVRLRRDGREFRQMCCMWTDIGKNALDDLIRVGRERAPWNCSEHNVYVGFEFVSNASHEFPEARDSDTLKGIQIYHWFEGCL